ncbi:MAG TPA: ABC transporter transmembrane domain-containing protein, partial [Chthoniobacteraceae bacterium]|nr:ABC transporter transmembrane domain-containing protein [Chthoniobacteraceae bacterium]
MHDVRSVPARPPLGELAHLFSYIRPYRSRFIVALLASSVSMAVGSLFPWLVGTLLDASIPSLKIVAAAPWQRDLNSVALVLVATLFVQAGLMFVASLSFNIVGERAVVDLREELYSTLITQPLRFFGEHRVGELTSRLSSDLAQIQDTLTFTVAQSVRQAMLLTAGLAMIAVTSVKLSLVMLSSVPLVMLVGVLFGRRIRRHSLLAQDRLAETATIVEETLHGIANVKAFGNEAFERRRYGGALRIYLDIILKNARHRAALIAFIIFVIFGAIVLVMWYGGHLMQRGELTHGELTRFVMYTLFIGGGVSSLPDIISTVQKALGATQRVRELLGERSEPGLCEKKDGLRREPSLTAHAGGHSAAAPSTRQPAQTDSRPAGRLRGSVRFESVHFRYPSRPDVPVLRGLDLAAAAGEKIALVGPSGAGKSTIVSLLLRFYEPDTGRLLLDGRDARDLDLATVRGNMAIVPQEVLLFGGSIRENIAYGRPGASFDEIRAAAERAHCHEFIARFSEGYDTLVGERGVQLSGGQRQRLAIARALLKDPAILILDEATSSLDSESEALIQRALDVLLQGRTAFIIAHRLATIRRADRIYVIENGVATESGTHDQLLAQAAGTYRR